MKRIMFKVVAALALLSVGLNLESNGKQLPKLKTDTAIQRFLDDYVGALNANDVMTLDRLTAANYTFVNQSGAVQNKQQRLALMRSGDLRYESVKYDETAIYRYRDAAIVVYRVEVKGRSRGMAFGGQFRSTLTLAKIRGRWQLVASQTTNIA